MKHTSRAADRSRFYAAAEDQQAMQLGNCGKAVSIFGTAGLWNAARRCPLSPLP